MTDKMKTPYKPAVVSLYCFSI